jgi:hypothetical protein
LRTLSDRVGRLARNIVDPEIWTTSRTPLVGGLIVVDQGGT